MGLQSELLSAVLADLPDADSRLGEPDPRWDAILGGRTGPDSWNQYGRAAGTTCIITLNGWAILAGFPDNMVVAVPTPMGGGTRMITAFNAGAGSRGWLHTPTRGELPDLRPGDAYEINHTTSDGSDGTHVGVVVSVTPSDDGQSLTVETADGGQGTRTAQFAGRNVRTFSLSSGAHPVVVQSPSGPGWLDRWVSVGGDEPNDMDPGGAPTLRAGSGALALGLLGAATLLGALAWHNYSRTGVVPYTGIDVADRWLAENLWRTRS